MSALNTLTYLGRVEVGSPDLSLQMSHSDHHRPHPAGAFIDQLPTHLHLHSGHVFWHDPARLHQVEGALVGDRQHIPVKRGLDL